MADVTKGLQLQQKQNQHLQQVIDLDSSSYPSPLGGSSALPNSSTSHTPNEEEFYPPPLPPIPPVVPRSPHSNRAQSVSPQRCFLPRPCPAAPSGADDAIPPPPLHPRKGGGGGAPVRATPLRCSTTFAPTFVHRPHRQSNPEELRRDARGFPLVRGFSADDKALHSTVMAGLHNPSSNTKGTLGMALQDSIGAQRRMGSGRGGANMARDWREERGSPGHGVRVDDIRIGGPGGILEARLRGGKKQALRRGDSDPVEISGLLDHGGMMSHDGRILNIAGGELAPSGSSNSSRVGTPQASERHPAGRAGANLQHVVPLDRWPFHSITPQQSSQLQHQRPETHMVLDRLNRKPAGNEYVDDPSTVKHVSVVENRFNGHTNLPANVGNSSQATHVNLRDCADVVTSQPAPSFVPKSLLPFENGKSMGGGETSAGCLDRVVCPRCGLCRCRTCTGRQVGGDEVAQGSLSPCEGGAGAELPSCWLAGGRFECSVDSCMDRLSCVCCLRTLFYHCLYDEDDDVDIVAQPFTCTDAPHCCVRWFIIVALLPLLPCLTLYALTEPVRCALQGCMTCRETCRGRQGCRCPTGHDGEGREAPSSSSGTATTSSSSGTTRSLLLDSAENSSA